MKDQNYFFVGLILMVILFACQKKQPETSALSMNVPVLETGSQQRMPNEWFDKATNHKIIKLSRRSGGGRSFYYS